MSTEPTGFSATAPQYFQNDLRRFNDALAPWIVTYDDGWRGVTPDAPVQLTSPYTRLVSMGYANGWFR